jgi:hypothetical protein
VLPLLLAVAFLAPGPDPVPLPPGAAWSCDPAGGDVRPAGSLAAAPETLALARRDPDRSTRLAIYRHVQEAAEARLAADADDIEARWWRVAAMGLRADDESARQKVVLAGEIRRDADEILARDPGHAGAHMALGRLHSGVLRLNPVLRFFALRLFGEADLGNASWDDAERHLRTAKETVPCALIHRWELARVLAYQGRDAEALDELDALLALPDTSPQDPLVRELAEELRARVAAR